jgi:outer membrane protein assembly factor BamB
VGRTVAITASGEADEGCLRAQVLLAIAGADLRRAGEIVDDAAGDADGTWDAGETIDLSLPLENAGDLDARTVAATLSFRGAPVAGVTIVRGSATYADVAQGATEPTRAPWFRLSAAPVMPPRTRVPLTLDVTLAGRPHRSFDVNLTVGRFVPGTVEWTYQPTPGRWIVEVTPLVLQLTDDDGSGVIDRCDVPDVVVVEERGNFTSSALVALSGDDGRVLWELEEPCTQISVFSAIAGGDVDGDGLNEIVTAVQDRMDCAISNTGTVKWRVPSQVPAGQSFSGGTHELSAWDLDGDGTVEVVAGHSALRGEDGTFEWSWPRINDRVTIVADLDLDGALEVIAAGNNVYRADGSPHPVAFQFRGFNSVPAVGNLDADPYPEIVQEFIGDVQCREHDGSLKWERTDLPGTRGATGPMALADVDGDTLAEVVVQCLSEILLLDPADGSTRWTMPIGDLSGSSGMSLFDFDGDGPPEIIFRDHSRLWVFDALDGEVLWETPMASGTAYEFPVVADVDGDGRAELIVLDGFVGGNERVRCIGNAPWPSARSVMNQEAYSVNHVGEDGDIVSSFAPRWLTGNDFRLQAVSCPCAGPRAAPTWSRPPDCATPTLCFSANVTGGVAPHRVTWDFGDGSPRQDGPAPCHEFPAAGGHAVRLFIEDASGCPGEWSGWVDVAGPLLADFTPPPACRGRDACFTASVSGGRAPHAIEWDFGDGTPRAGGPSACHSYSSFGTFSAWMLVTDADGCSRDVAHDVVVPAAPADVGAALRVRDHGPSTAPNVTAVLDWSLDEGAPRPAGVGHVVLRGTSPTALADVDPPVFGPVTLVESTPRTPGPLGVHFYVVLAEDACGARSDS